jgi:large subunit ribosomal protein L18
MKRLIEKNQRRKRRKARIRGKIKGSSDIPRISVFKSNKNLYIQAIDDVAGTTIASVSNLEKDLKDLKKNIADAEKLGKVFGDRLKEKKIKQAVFDRSGYLYHGIIKAIADGARKTGLKF